MKIIYACLLICVKIRKQYSVLLNTDKGRSGCPAFICIILPQTSHSPSNLNHPDVAEPIMQVLSLDHIAQLVAYDFGATNLRVDVRVQVPKYPAVDWLSAMPGKIQDREWNLDPDASRLFCT